MMKPASVVIPELEEEQILCGEGHPTAAPYSVLRLDGGHLLSRWELEADDRQRIAEGGDVYVFIQTYGKPQQPIMLTTVKPVQS